MRETLVVGAGLAGAVMARRLAEKGDRVIVVDRRAHIAGNCYDCFDEHGVWIHEYGPHVFHTNSQYVWDFVGRFAEWRRYEQRALASVRGELLPIPINRTTLERFFDVRLPTDEDAEALLDGLTAGAPIHPHTSEEICLARVGHELYEAFYRGYTRKHWGVDPSQLDRSVCARIPVRTNRDDRYFTDRWQGVPVAGYSTMVASMLDHPHIRVELRADGLPLVADWRGKVVWTGAIDELWDYCLGRLPYRSVRFELRSYPSRELVQPAAATNFPSEDVAWTRETEFRHITGQEHDSTTVMREIPSAEGDPYYPVPHNTNRLLYRRYERLTQRELPNVVLVGRLARYQYLNMDQVIAQALTTAGEI